MAEQGRSWWFYAGAAAGAYTAYRVLRPGKSSAPDYDTDFTGFLADPQQWAAPSARAAPAAAAVDETSFDAFLRTQPAVEEADPTGFDSFLRVPVGGASSAAAAAQQSKAAVVVEEVPTDRAGVVVMYGTEYGFSKEIAEKLCAQLKAGDGFWWVLCPRWRARLFACCVDSGSAALLFVLH